MRRKLKGEELETVEELEDRVPELLDQATFETMQRVHEHWIGRLNQIMHTGGNYV
jgi:hypothetical protein